MPTCWKVQPVAVSGTATLLVNAVSADNTQMMVIDNVTPIANCQALTLSPAEYAELSHGYIPTRQDAELIAGAFLVLLATAATFRYIVEAFSGPDDSMSDEKH